MFNYLPINYLESMQHLKHVDHKSLRVGAAIALAVLALTISVAVSV